MPELNSPHLISYTGDVLRIVPVQLAIPGDVTIRERKTITVRKPRSSLSRSRSSVSARLAGLELPECFRDASVAAALNSIDRNQDKRLQRRLVDRAVRIAVAR